MGFKDCGLGGEWTTSVCSKFHVQDVLGFWSIEFCWETNMKSIVICITVNKYESGGGIIYNHVGTSTAPWGTQALITLKSEL